MMLEVNIYAKNQSFSKVFRMCSACLHSNNSSKHLETKIVSIGPRLQTILALSQYKSVGRTIILALRTALWNQSQVYDACDTLSGRHVMFIFLHVPRGLKTEYSDLYISPSHVRMRENFYCPVDTPYTLPTAGTKSVMTAPKMYNTEYQNVGSKKPIIV